MKPNERLGYNNMSLLDVLWHLKQHGPGPRYRAFGICYIASNSLNTGGDYLRMKALFKRWPEYTGSCRYPVPGTDGRDEEQAYDDGVLWSGEYGGNRLRLINFCIRELERELSGDLPYAA
jgi:hypothetical protein